MAISVVTAMELYFGALNKVELNMNKRHISAIQIIYVDEEISMKASSLVERYAKSHGLKIPDAMIASTSLINQLKLYTFNKKDFLFIEKINLY